MKVLLGTSLCALLFLTMPAFADITATYAGPRNVTTMTIEVAADGDVRGTTSNPNAYFITRDGQGYMIQATFNGPAVMRVEDVAAVLAEQMKKMSPNLPKEGKVDVSEPPLIKGGIVTVRGRQGIAYYAGKDTKGAPVGEPVMVISADPNLAPLGVAMARQFDMSVAGMHEMTGRSGGFASWQAVLRTGAPLQFAGMELDTVNYDAIPAAHFALPAEPLKMDDVRKNMGVPPQ